MAREERRWKIVAHSDVPLGEWWMLLCHSVGLNRKRWNILPRFPAATIVHCCELREKYGLSAQLISAKDEYAESNVPWTSSDLSL